MTTNLVTLHENLVLLHLRRFLDSRMGQIPNAGNEIQLIFMGPIAYTGSCYLFRQRKIFPFPSLMKSDEWSGPCVSLWQ